jgi:hypothetical protein
MSDAGYKVCAYRNVPAAFRRFLGVHPTGTWTRLTPLLNVTDRLVLRISGRARKRDGVADVGKSGDVGDRPLEA